MINHIATIVVHKFPTLMTSDENDYFSQRLPQNSPLENVAISLHFSLYNDKIEIIFPYL